MMPPLLFSKMTFGVKVLDDRMNRRMLRIMSEVNNVIWLIIGLGTIFGFLAKPIIKRIEAERKAREEKERQQRHVQLLHDLAEKKRAERQLTSVHVL